MELEATGRLKTYVVTINAGTGGSVSQSSVTVTHGTEISASGNILTIGTTQITATANTRYEFDRYVGIPESGEVTGAITITAEFAATIEVSIEVEGNSNRGEVYQITVNGEDVYSSSTTIRSGSSIEIGGQTRASDEEANDYQLVSIYVNDELRVGPLTGSIVGTGTNLGVVTSDVTIRYEYENAYKMTVSVTDKDNTNGISIEAEKKTEDDIIAESSTVTITIDEASILEGMSDRDYIGLIYTIGGESTSVSTEGDEVITWNPDTSSGIYEYEIGSEVVIDNIEVIVKRAVELTTVIEEGSDGLDLISEDGFVRVIRSSGRYIVYEGRWRIVTSEQDQSAIEAMLNGMMVTLESDGYYYITF